MKITAIITSGIYPVPPTQGGAVENLVWNLICSNEIYNKSQFEVISIQTAESILLSKNILKSSFKFILIPKIIYYIDKLIIFLVRMIYKKDLTRYEHVFQRLWFIFNVAKILRYEDYDKLVLENKSELFYSLSLFGNSKRYKGSVFYHAHNEIKLYPGIKKHIKQCNRFLCVSDYIGSTIISTANYVCNIYTLRNGIDISRFSDLSNEENLLDIKTKYHLADKEIIILYFGRITPEKGIHELIMSLKYLKHQNFSLLIIGGEDNSSHRASFYENQLYKLVEQLELEDKVVFYGYCAYEEIPKTIAIADIIVLPSLWNEPAMLTAVEGMAAGKPIISTNVGGTPEMITGDCGMLLNADNLLAENIATAIDNLCYRQDIRIAMGDNGKARAKDNFSIEKYYFDFINSISNY
jgi:glycosyltransferase involved in cell wall biosynthesis